MQCLSDREILAVWEEAAPQHPVDRALTVLEAFAREPKAKLARLSVGQRDRQLLRARTALLGPSLPGYAECPECAERLEFTVPADGLFSAGSEPPENPHYRLPDSFDLAAIARCSHLEEARDLLLQRCLADSKRTDLLDEIAERESPVSVDLACPSCACRWELPLDIASFFWEELCVYARRRLREVDALARAYGWSEVEILSLSRVRRQMYIEMVS